MREQYIIRIYPPGYTGDSIGDVNKYLKSGWTVKLVTTISDGKHTFNDYVLERETTQTK